MVWDISDPRPVFVTYANNRDFTVASERPATWRRKGSSSSRRTSSHRSAPAPCRQRVERHDDGVGDGKVGSSDTAWQAGQHSARAEVLVTITSPFLRDCRNVQCTGYTIDAVGMLPGNRLRRVFGNFWCVAEVQPFLAGAQDLDLVIVDESFIDTSALHRYRHDCA